MNNYFSCLTNCNIIKNLSVSVLKKNKQKKYKTDAI